MYRLPFFSVLRTAWSKVQYNMMFAIPTVFRNNVTLRNNNKKTSLGFSICTEGFMKVQETWNELETIHEQNVWTKNARTVFSTAVFA